MNLKALQLDCFVANQVFGALFPNLHPLTLSLFSADLLACPDVMHLLQARAASGEGRVGDFGSQVRFRQLGSTPKTHALLACESALTTSASCPKSGCFPCVRLATHVSTTVFLVVLTVQCRVILHFRGSQLVDHFFFLLLSTRFLVKTTQLWHEDVGKCRTSNFAPTVLWGPAGAQVAARRWGGGKTACPEVLRTAKAALKTSLPHANMQRLLQCPFPWFCDFAIPERRTIV